MNDNRRAPQQDRREFLATTGVAAVAAGTSIWAAARDVKATEMKDAGPLLDCYTDRLSYLPGEKATFFTSTSAPTYAVEIAREGAQREVVYRKDGNRGKLHDVPDNASENGCRWPDAFSWTIPYDARSGYYSVVLRCRDDKGREQRADHFFAVRSPKRDKDAKILMVLSTNTYLAYNMFGGQCYYDGPTGPESAAHKLSFLRPFQRGLLHRPADAPRNCYVGNQPEPGESISYGYFEWAAKNGYNPWTAGAGWAGWESRFVRWAENNGYQLDFAVSSDLEFHPECVEDYKCVTAVGHDEYWSWKMRDTLENYIVRGGNVAFFVGNAIFWQVRFEDNGNSMICYKAAARDRDPVRNDPDKRHLLTTIWSSSIVNRPENQLLGNSFCQAGYVNLGGIAPRHSAGYTIWRDDHWVFEGADVHFGDNLGGKHSLIGYEVDGCELTLKNGLPVPTHSDGTPATMVVLGTAPATLAESEKRYPQGWFGEGDLRLVAREQFGDDSPEKLDKTRYGHAVMGVYTRGKGTVFTAGTTEWAHVLDAGDKQVDRITRNILSRFTRT